jgi:hypothetical protein
MGEMNAGLNPTNPRGAVGFVHESNAIGAAGVLHKAMHSNRKYMEEERDRKRELHGDCIIILSPSQEWPPSYRAAAKFLLLQILSKKNCGKIAVDILIVSSPGDPFT